MKYTLKQLSKILDRIFGEPLGGFFGALLIWGIIFGIIIIYDNINN